LSNLEQYETPAFIWENQAAPFEILAFGDVAQHDVCLKAAFSRPPAEPGPEESLHLPVRDLRLRYRSHAITQGA